MEQKALDVVKSVTNTHDLGLTGHWTNVREEMLKNGEDVAPRITGSQFCEELRNTYDGKYKKMFDLKTTNYHQMIAHPVRHDELYVVQLLRNDSNLMINKEEMEEIAEAN